MKRGSDEPLLSLMHKKKILLIDSTKSIHSKSSQYHKQRKPKSWKRVGNNFILFIMAVQTKIQQVSACIGRKQGRTQQVSACIGRKQGRTQQVPACIMQMLIRIPQVLPCLKQVTACIGRLQLSFGCMPAGI